MNYTKIIFSFLAAVFMLASCGKSGDIADAIPADAKYVISINSKSLVEKSDYDIFKNPTVQQGINMMKVGLKDEASTKILDKFLEDTNSLGLNVKGDAYMYTNFSEFGLVLSVNDADRLKEALKTFRIEEEQIKKEGDIYSVSLDNRTCLVWNSSKFLFVTKVPSFAYSNGDKKEDVDVLQLATAQLTQGSDKSIKSVKSFQDFAANLKDVSVFYTMSGMDKMMEMYGASDMTEVLQGPFGKIMKEVEGVSIGMYTSFETGEIKMTSKYFYDTPEAEKRLKDLTQQMTGEIKGDHFKYFTSDPLFAFSVNIKGDGIFNYFDKLGLVKEITKELGDSTNTALFEKVFKNLNGDVTLSVNTIKQVTKTYDTEVIAGEDDIELDNTYTDTNAECMFFADLTDGTDLIAFIKSKIAEDKTAKIVELTPTTFKFTTDGMDVYFGLKDKMFFITNVESVFNNLGATDLKNNYSSLIKGKSCVMFGDIQTVMPFLTQEIEGSLKSPSALTFAKLFGKYDFTTSASDFTGEGKLIINDNSKNSLAVMWQHIDKTITELQTSF